MNTRYSEYCKRQIALHGDKFTESDLDPRFVPAFNEGDTYRVKVKFSYGSEVWGYVGVTTGWKPAFLLMRRRGQIGSSDLLGPQDVILASKRI